jgi:hypothetical protein
MRELDVSDEMTTAIEEIGRRIQAVPTRTELGQGLLPWTRNIIFYINKIHTRTDTIT